MLKMAIVKRVKGKWMITNIGLSDIEVQDLKNKLEKSDDDPDYTIVVGYEIKYQPNED